MLQPRWFLGAGLCSVGNRGDNGSVSLGRAREAAVPSGMLCWADNGHVPLLGARGACRGCWHPPSLFSPLFSLSHLCEPA